MITIRHAMREDSNLIFKFINELAIYEKMMAEVTGSSSLIEKWIFDEKKADVIFLMKDNKEIGFALYFYNFSTFKSKPGIYLEDLFIKEEFRNQGFGTLFFKFLAEKAIKEDLSRIEWVCLEWNKPSIDFYLKLGAKPLKEWSVFRLDEQAIYKLNN